MTLYKYFFKQSSTDDRQLLGILASSTNNVSGNKSVTFSPEDRYYHSNEWYALSKSDKDNFLKVRKRRNVGKKASKLGGYSKSGEGSNNGQGKWKSNITMLEKKVRNQKRKFLVFNTTDNPDSDNEESDDSNKEDGNKKHSTLTRQRNSKRYNKA